VQAKVREGSTVGRSGTTRGGFVKEVGFKPLWNREKVIDEQSGETEEEEVKVEVIGESELEELVPE